MSEMHSKIKEQTKLVQYKIEIVGAKDADISKLRGDIKCLKFTCRTSAKGRCQKHPEGVPRFLGRYLPYTPFIWGYQTIFSISR